jgi:hypothetical protein
MNSYYTYELCSSETPTIPFYIGKGISYRMYKHEKKAIKYPNIYSYVLNKIRSILKEGHTIVYRKIVENVSEQEALRCEIERITVLKIMGFKLCNMTNGGEGSSGYKHTEEWKQEQRKRFLGKNNPMYGKEGTRKGIPCSIEAKIKSSKSHTGLIYGPHSEEHKEKIRRGNIGKHKELHSKESYERAAQKLRGRKLPPCTEERKQKMRIIMKGKNTAPWTEERKKSQSAVAKLGWITRRNNL